MQIQGYQQLIVILILLCLWNVESQCDPYIEFGETSTIGGTSLFNGVFPKCLPDSYKYYQQSMWYHYNKGYTSRESTTHRSKVPYTSYNYSRCDHEFNLNTTYTQKCDNDNCVSFQDMNEYFNTQADIQTCESYLSSNFLIGSVGVGYYRNICNYTSNPLYVKYECICDNSYQLTFYSSDKKCLFRTSSFGGNTLFDSNAEIDCSINECPDADADDDMMISHDNTLTLFEQDYECTNQCIISKTKIVCLDRSYNRSIIQSYIENT